LPDVFTGKPTRFGRCASVAIIAPTHAVVSMQRKKSMRCDRYTKFLCALRCMDA
jgi:hypothetical protein